MSSDSTSKPAVKVCDDWHLISQAAKAVHVMPWLTGMHNGSNRQQDQHGACITVDDVTYHDSNQQHVEVNICAAFILLLLGRPTLQAPQAALKEFAL